MFLICCPAIPRRLPLSCVIYDGMSPGSRMRRGRETSFLYDHDSELVYFTFIHISLYEVTIVMSDTKEAGKCRF